MIKVKRGNQPEVLVKNAVKWQQQLAAAQTVNARKSIQKKYAHTAVYDATMRCSTANALTARVKLIILIFRR